MVTEENANLLEGNMPATEPLVGKKTISIIPADEINLSDLLFNVSKSWKQNPQITIPWITQVQFEEQATQFRSQITQRKQTGDTRSPATKEFASLDAIINRSIKYVKGYIKDAYDEENASAYYPQFGLVKTGNVYKMPYDRNNRSEALHTMLTGLAAHHFDQMKYGTAFWTPIKERYNVLLSQVVDTDSSVSGIVKDKKQMHKQVKKVLNALINIIKAYNPDDYKSVLRTWGFQKEKY